MELEFLGRGSGRAKNFRGLGKKLKQKNRGNNLISVPQDYKQGDAEETRGGERSTWLSNKKKISVAGLGRCREKTQTFKRWMRDRTLSPYDLAERKKVPQNFFRGKGVTPLWD